MGRRRRRVRLRWGTVLALLLLVGTVAYIGHNRSSAAPHASHHASAHSRTRRSSGPAPIVWVPPGAQPNVALHEPDAVLAVYGQADPIFQQNPSQAGPIASTTKLMTAYLVAETLPMNQVVAISPTAAATGGSDMRMYVGERFTVRQLLTGMLMVSANDAAVALAEAVAGHTQNFVALMNRTALALGLHHTHYADPDGISPGSSSSAGDLLKLAELDLAIPTIRQIVDTKTANLPNNANIINIDGLLWRDPTVIGLKTGWTSQAECTLVFAATRSVEGHPVTLVGVLLHARLFNTEYNDAEALLNWGFSAVAPTMGVLSYQHRVPAVLNP